MKKDTQRDKGRKTESETKDKRQNDRQRYKDRQTE